MPPARRNDRTVHFARAESTFIRRGLRPALSRPVLADIERGARTRCKRAIEPRTLRENARRDEEPKEEPPD